MSPRGAPQAAELRALFNPTSIALVGATDNSGWSRNTFENLRTHGFTGAIYLVNPHGEVVHGQRAHPSLAEIGRPVDLAYVMVPTTAVLPALREGAALGIRHYVVLTAGFAETNEAGSRLETELVDYALAHDLIVLGPNGNGYINAAGAVTPYGLRIPSELDVGPVGAVVQSGAVANAFLTLAQAHGIGISMLTSMGNEAMVTVADVMNHLLRDPHTKVIALFLESVRRPEEFVAVTRRAARARKPVVALKIGASRLASHTARTHTGALVGDDAVSDTAFRRLGVIRVRSLEELLVTAGLLANTPPLPGRRVGVVTPSGGASELVADRAQQDGLELPSYAPETVAALRGMLPPFATVANPLDVTGYVMVDRTLLAQALSIVTHDPGIDMVLLVSDLPRAAPADPEPTLALYRSSSRLIREAPHPVVVVGNVLTDVSEFGRRVQRETGYPYVAGGIEHGMAALGAAVWWAETAPVAASRVPTPPPDPPLLPAPAEGVWTEHQASALLAAAGVPVVPGELAADETSAAEAAAGFGYPVVLKAVADGLVHKSETGVRLNLADEDAVRHAHRAVTAALRAAGTTGGATLIQPQRSGGLELLVGVLRDPTWGLALTLGLGGVWTEVLADTAQHLLPVTESDVRATIGELRGAALLYGASGTPPVDLDMLAAVVARIGQLASSLGERLESLEVNPLLARGAKIEALDALITWRR
jgi:acyl-CoA synthetase (NDP forming)